jgi:hypothetical protein
VTPALAVTALVLGALSGPAGPASGASVTRDDARVAAARAADARITLSLRHSRRARRDPRAFPTDDEFRSAFLAFRARYPDIRDWIVWNEANHPSSLSARRRGRVARLFDIATTTCPRCRIVGRALRHALSLACLSRRVRRVYVYNWQAPGVPTTWDSGLIGPRGNARPAFHALAALVRLARGPVIHCRGGALVVPRS